MKKATEILTITKVAIEKERETIRKRTMDFIENGVAPRVEEEASKGGYYVRICKISEGIDLDLVEKEVAELGYSVSRKGRDLKISWYFWEVK